MDNIGNGLGALAFWGFIAAVSIVPMIMRGREKKELHQIIASAIEKDKAVPPELLASLKEPPRNDLRNGIITLAVAAGILVLGYAIFTGLRATGDEDAYMALNAIMGAAAIPGLLGLAFIVLGLLGIGKEKP